MAYSIKPFEKVVYSCGCFSGEIQELLNYIENRDSELFKSRKLAVSFVRARMNQMIKSRKEIK